MADIMRPVPFGELLNRIFGEYKNHGSIFGLDKDQFYRDNGKNTYKVFGQTCSTPMGPAAGPHTQLAQNIITSYLAGARFIELKTVQVMDDLDIAKPCIDARDEGYNVEWSTEYTLPKAWDEYAKAWIIIHLLEALMNGGKFEKPSFIFNMSVGYNLEGIKTDKMQHYIDSMIDAHNDPRFEEYLEELEAELDDGILFEGTDFENAASKLKGLSKKISYNISPSVTISTMHGCPPKEIEAICTYMLTQKKLNTFVKLNPTLLGYDAVREILDALGYDYVTLKRESFEKDLQYDDAVVMLHRLVDLAARQKLGFGVKLTNTLGSVNDQGQLPGEEMYMSGRALMPISVNVAAKLSREFDGLLPVSYSGGANALTVGDIFSTGIRPITVATDMLHPGGYTRLTQMVNILNGSKDRNMTRIDVSRIENLAKKAVTTDYLKKSFRGTDSIKLERELPLTDCYVAPCVEACPIHQDIPDYVSLVGEGKYAEALEVIYEGNALPNITSYICDHQCQHHCSRLDYEGAVQIREMKRIAVQNGFREYIKNWHGPGEPSDVKAAVIGAGPAGLSAAYFLTRAGFQTEIFEKEANAGGVVKNIIPQFRIPDEVVMADISFIEAHGVKINYSCDRKDTTVDALREKGFEYIFYAIGTEKDNLLRMEGDTSAVMPSLEFLRSYVADPQVSVGSNIVIVGGGNVAMDAARAAVRTPGNVSVTVVYRRSEKEMPCDREEYEEALRDGVEFRFLANPKCYENGVLTLSIMELGDVDESGRRSFVDTGRTENIPCDRIISAVASHPDEGDLNWYGLKMDAKGRAEVDEDTLETSIDKVYAIGDMHSGPSTVVRCIASARKAVEAAIDKIYDELEEEEECDCGCHDHDEECHCHEDGEECHCHDDECGCDDDECDCEDEDDDEDIEALTEAENRFFSYIRSKKSHITQSTEKGDRDFAETEARRCLDCSYICNKCVDVCPNRANVAIDVRNCGVFDNPFQILHLDAYCNECGNCEVFCPYQGGPYRKKFTLFSTRWDFEHSENDGFLVEGEVITVRSKGEIYDCSINGEGVLEGDKEGLSDEVAALIIEVFTSYSYLLGEVDE